MDSQTGTGFTMRHPERWLAVLRIAVGVWFAKAIFTKLSITLAWGFLPVPTASDRWLHVMPILATKYAEGNPITVFKEFLLGTVVPNSHVYAQLTAFGEAAVGLGLVFGCWTVLASAIGLVLVVNYGLAAPGVWMVGCARVAPARGSRGSRSARGCTADRSAAPPS